MRGTPSDLGSGGDVHPLTKGILRYKYLLGSALLLCFLGVPWVLSVLSPSLEPYPAVVLPTGARTVSLEEETIPHSRVSLWARRKGGSWQELSAEELLTPIPRHFLPAMVKTDLGLKNTDYKVLSARLLPDLEIPRNKVAPRETAAAASYLADRLEVLGYRPDSLEIRQEALIINRHGGQITEREITDAKRYSLR